MKLISLLPALCLLSFPSLAHAAGVKVGLDLQASAFVLADSSSSGVPVSLGAHVMLGGPSTPEDGWRWRGTLEGQYYFAGAGKLALDATLLRQQPDFYFGGGVGSGVFLDFRSNAFESGLAFGPLLLTNLHGVVGTQLGGVQLEGVLRVGLISGAELRVNLPLP
ncbi:hypothetical protein [Deinococcus sp.]|uniref:hypothetical protein n=1 Tax=Deinococcus sp. TaxID=47478 RepID=UPI003CC612BE